MPGYAADGTVDPPLRRATRVPSAGADDDDGGGGKPAGATGVSAPRGSAGPRRSLARSTGGAGGMVGNGVPGPAGATPGSPGPAATSPPVVMIGSAGLATTVPATGEVASAV